MSLTAPRAGLARALISSALLLFAIPAPAQQQPASRSARTAGAGVTTGTPQRAAAARLSPVEQRIRAVENGLLPSIRVKGRALRNMTIPARMRKYAVPGVSIAVINDNAIEWARTWGVAAAGEKTALDTTTLFQAGAASQPVAAAVALALVQIRKLDLKRDANRYLKGWKIPKSDLTKNQKVTIRTLLGRLGGLSSIALPGYAADSAPSLAQRLNGVIVDQIPTLEYRETGADYLVLEQVLADQMKRPFGDLAAEMVLRPLGMNGSVFGSPDGRATAAGHDRGGKMIAGRARTYPELAASGLWTTPSDLARFALEVQAGVAGRSPRLLTPETARLMITPEQYSPAGLGLVPVGRDSTLRFAQRGATEGFQMEMVAYLHRGQGAVVMTNGAGGGALVEEILNAIARVYDWPGYLPPEKVVARVDHRVYDRFTGVYRAGDDTLSVRKRGSRLYVAAGGATATELLAESVSEFFTTEGDAVYSFVFDEDGNVGAVTVRRREGETRWNRI